MCKDNCPENKNQVLLQIYHERGNQLSNMLITINGFMLAFVSGLLTFVGSSAFTNECCKDVSIGTLISSGCWNPWPVLIAINIAIIVIILWRFYAHLIDDDIVETYGKILRCEDGVELDASLLKGLLKKFDPNGWENEYEKLKGNKSLQESRRQKYIEIIDKGGDFPPRGHMGLDCLAFTICCALCIAEFFLFYRTTQDFIIIGFFSVSLTLLFFCILFSRFRKLECVKKYLLFDKIGCFLTVTIVFALILLVTISYKHFPS